MRLGCPSAAMVQASNIWSLVVTYIVLIHTYSVFFPDVMRLKQRPREGTCSPTKLPVETFGQKVVLANLKHMMGKGLEELILFKY